MANFIFGSGNNDELNGTDAADAIFGNGGNDQISGLDGDDVLAGGSGNDLIQGGLGVDTIDGDRGADILIGDKGDDVIRGGDGADLLIWNNGDGSDLMDGGGDFDRLQVNGAEAAGDQFTIVAGGADVLFDRINLGLFQLNVNNTERLEVNGGAGDDSFTVGDLAGAKLQDVRFNGGEGNDTLDAGEATTIVRAFGGAGDDLLQGGFANDVLRGDDGNDIIIGFRGDDDIAGGLGDDRMIWNNGDGSDLMRGGAGQDVVEVNGADGLGDDFTLQANGDLVSFARVNLGLFELTIDGTESMEINGQDGNDRLAIGDLAGTDLQHVTFSGGLGDDILDAGLATRDITALGGDGNDLMVTGTGDDQIDGGTGNDTIVGRGGADVITTGDGEDQVILTSADTLTITDLVVGDDTVDITALLDVALPPAAGGGSDFTGFVNVIDDGQDSQLQIDADGGGDDFVTVALLTGVSGAAVEQIVADPAAIA